jgi:hypothetical protein
MPAARRAFNRLLPRKKEVRMTPGSSGIPTGATRGNSAFDMEERKENT